MKKQQNKNKVEAEMLDMKHKNTETLAKFVIPYMKTKKCNKTVARIDHWIDMVNKIPCAYIDLIKIGSKKVIR